MTSPRPPDRKRTERAARLAEALRLNLKRRKAQARARAAAARHGTTGTTRERDEQGPNGD